MRDTPEAAKFESRSFSDLLTYAKNWKQEVRLLTNPGFSKLGLMRQGKDRLNLYVIATAAGTGTQSIFTAAIPLELTDGRQPNDPKIEVKLKPGLNLEPLLRKAAPSAEFTLFCERQRSQVTQGVTDYEICKQEMTLVAGDQVFRYRPGPETITPVTIGVPEPRNGQKESIKNTVEPMDVSESSGPGAEGCSAEPPLSTSSTSTTPQKKTNEPSAPPSPDFVCSARLCPANNQYLAYVLNKQVYIEKSGKIVHHTASDSKHITNGVPSYIVQEELERFEGIWWSETHTRLLYEHVNEEAVADAQFGVNGDCPSAPMKYPRAGGDNATSQLRMVVLEEDRVYDVALNNNVLRKHFKDYEYITRAGFFSDGTSVWVQLMNRDQSECCLVLVPFCEFDLPNDLRGTTPPSNTETQMADHIEMSYWDPTDRDNGEKPPRGKLIGSALMHRDRNHYWINTHNAIYPLKIEDQEQPKYEFIYCLEKQQGSCLYLISAELDTNGYCRHSDETILMAPAYSINKSMEIVVDESRNLVYYVANESHPTEWNVCVSNYRTKAHAQLTESGICFKSERANGKLAIDLDYGFACWMTSVGSPPECRFYSFKWNDGGDGLPVATPTAVFQAWLNTAPGPIDSQVDVPEMIEFQSKRTGLMHYAMVLRPGNFDPYKRYPVFHYVYGGPGIQIVHNDYTWVQLVRFARLGYVVVVLDNRGSAHRGIDFEGHISRKMGTVEVEDQVEGLQMLAERTGGFMDLTRVIVHGWSYGGYMALQMLAKHPKLYTAAIAGGAVSDWRLYDTAYTERYMGYPVVEKVYHDSSVIKLVDKLPDEPNRLMLVHGFLDENVHFSHLTTLIDECIKNGKWHELVIFPKERHGIRNTEASIYLDARMMYFAQTAIKNVVMSTAPVQGDTA